jgi:hypothetical protein
MSTLEYQEIRDILDTYRSNQRDNGYFRLKDGTPCEGSILAIQGQSLFFKYFSQPFNDKGISYDPLEIPIDDIDLCTLR